MTYIIIGSILASIVAVSVILAILKYYKTSAHILTIFMMLTGFLCGCWYIGKTTNYLAPFFAFGIRKTLDENITVVRSHQRIIEFSNGETIHSADLLLFSVVEICAFIFVAGTVYIIVRYFVFFITGKISPAVYQYLKIFSTTGGKKNK